MKEYILTYTLGDPSDDGHGKTEEGYIKVNHSNKELEDAMRKFNESTKCNWKDWCEDYEECTIIYEDTKSILSYLGYNINSLEDIENLDNFPYEIEEFNDNIFGLSLNTRSYIKLLMDICKVAIPDLEWSRYYPVSTTAFFDGQGYGLFY